MDSSKNTFVLKTYTKSYRGQPYLAEVNAFLRLRNADHPESQIKYFSSFEKGQTFNIILEYAEGGTLNDFFKRTEPPRSLQDIFYFWKGLMEILLALKIIQQLKEVEHWSRSEQCQR